MRVCRLHVLLIYNVCHSLLHKHRAKVLLYEMCSVFQPMLMPRRAGALRFVPFVGLAAWLIGGAADSDAADDGTSPEHH